MRESVVGAAARGKVAFGTLLVAIVISIGCTEGPATTSSKSNSANNSAVANSVLKKENLSYADRQAWRSRLNWPQDCESSFDYPDKSLGGLDFYELSDKHYLVQVTCTLGAYQGTYVFLQLDESVSPAKSKVLHFVNFEDSGESGPARLQKTQAIEITGTPEFDQTTKQLRIVNKFRGIGDCGFLTSYTFPNGEPQLTSLQGKLDCDGKATSPRDWKKLTPR